MQAHHNATSPAIWLIPFVQLKATARQVWQSTGLSPLSPLPQILTVREWALGMGTVPKTQDDLQFDVGMDRITAESLLRRAGLEVFPAFTQRVLDGAYELAKPAAAIRPESRLTWAGLQASSTHAAQFQVENVLNRIAIMWAATSSYDTDVLWQRQAQWQQTVPHFYVSSGLQADALTTALLAAVPDFATKVTSISLTPIPSDPLPLPAQAIGQIVTQIVAADAEDLVQQAVLGVIKAVPKSFNPAHPKANLEHFIIKTEIIKRLCNILPGIS